MFFKRLIEYKRKLSKSSWFSSLFWIVITAVVTIMIEKSCDKIIPESSIIINDYSDTVKMIHSYDIENVNDTSINVQLKNRIENIKLLEEYEKIIYKRRKNSNFNNSIKLDISLPNKKGFLIKSAITSFVLNISSLNENIIEFHMSFFNDDIIDDIYCLCLSVCRIVDAKRVIYIEEFYAINGVDNNILVANSFPSGKYEATIGFVLKSDITSDYPCLYKQTISFSK